MVRKPSVRSLIGATLQHSSEDDRYWDAITQLRVRAEPTTVAAMWSLFRSGKWRKQELAVYVMCQLSRKLPGERWSSPYAEDDSRKMIGEAFNASHRAVIVAAINACSHRDCPHLLSQILAHLHSLDASVRFQVANALGHYESMESADALMFLMCDTDDDVRDWATFSLGTQLKMDTPAIRSALLERLEDSNADVRGEAACGLACRSDLRVIPVIARELQRTDCTAYYLDAATELASPELLPLLLQLRDDLPEEEDASQYWLACLEDAIAACAGEAAA